MGERRARRTSTASSGWTPAAASTPAPPRTATSIRAYDTTYSISRFNNSATQVTLLVIQNTSTDTVAGTAWLWNAAGTLVISQPFSLAPNAVFVVNTSTLAPGVGGSITVSHDGRYGSLAGQGRGRRTRHRLHLRYGHGAAREVAQRLTLRS